VVITLKNFGNDDILASTPITTTGQVQDRAPVNITLSGAIIGYDYHGTVDTATCVVRSTDASGKVLLDIMAGGALSQVVQFSREQWRKFSSGIHVTIVSGGRLTVYYIPDELKT